MQKELKWSPETERSYLDILDSFMQADEPIHAAGIRGNHQAAAIIAAWPFVAPKLITTQPVGAPASAGTAGTANQWGWLWMCHHTTSTEQVAIASGLSLEATARILAQLISCRLILPNGEVQASARVSVIGEAGKRGRVKYG